MIIYAPVVKGKMHDLIGLGQLDEDARGKIKPLIEFLPSKKDGKVIDTELVGFSNHLIDHVPLGEIFLDFRGLKPEVLTTHGENATIAGFELINNRRRRFTPVFGFGRAVDKQSEEHIWLKLKDVVLKNQCGFCFRLEIDDLEDEAQNTWQSIVEKSANFQLKPSEIDIYIDLRHIGEKSTNDLINILLDFFSLNRDAKNYRSIIVSGSSTLKDVGGVPIDGILKVSRKELFLWSELIADLPDDMSVIFGDYGVIHPAASESPSGGSSNMNAKIRYTSKSNIYYFRGHKLFDKPEPPDFEQFHDIALRVVQSGYFTPKLSTGDLYLEKVAQNLVAVTCANDFIHSDLNHHFKYTIGQLEKVLQVVRISENIEELLETI